MPGRPLSQVPLILRDREVFIISSRNLPITGSSIWRAYMGRRLDEAREEAFLADYDRRFPRGSGDAGREVARGSTSTDGGWDCALTSDGRVLGFEAKRHHVIHLMNPVTSSRYKHRTSAHLTRR